MTAKCRLAYMAALATVARCSLRTIADVGAATLIAKSAGGLLFSALSRLYLAASITILGVDK